MRWARATNRVMKSRRAKPANSATRRITVDANERFRSVVPTIQPLLRNPQGTYDVEVLEFCFARRADAIRRGRRRRRGGTSCGCAESGSKTKLTARVPWRLRNSRIY